MANLPSNACAYPFKAAMLANGTPATPCCKFHDRYLSEDDNKYVFKDIRETMLKNEWHKGCWKCKADEDSGHASMRTEADEFFNDFTDSIQLEYLEITVGNLCNLACVGCGPEYSHTWDKDARAIKLVTNEVLEHFSKNREYDLDSLSMDQLSHLKNMKVTGGEPFMHKQFLRFIKRLVDSGIAPNIDIEIFTNCTYWPAKMNLDYLLEFNNLRVTNSIDAVGGLNDILRHPSKFPDIETVLKKWAELGTKYDKVEVFVACTVGALNAPVLIDLMKWARFDIGVQIMLQTIHEPDWLSIAHQTDTYKNNLRTMVEEQYKDCHWKLKKAYTLLISLCKTNNAEDNSEIYLDQMNTLFDLRNNNAEEYIHGYKKLLNERY